MIENCVDGTVFASSGLGEMITAINKANEILYSHRLFGTINDLGAWVVPEDLNSNDVFLNHYFNHNTNHQMEEPSC